MDRSSSDVKLAGGPSIEVLTSITVAFALRLGCHDAVGSFCQSQIKSE
ncbi:MAG: hypothetical protein AAFN59_12400 [Pseudomonadota bacterium]